MILPSVYISANGTGSPLINSISLTTEHLFSNYLHDIRKVNNIEFAYRNRLPNDSNRPMVKQTAHPPRRCDHVRAGQKEHISSSSSSYHS